MINLLSHAGQLDYNTMEFILDTISDIEDLKINYKTCDAGSTAFVIATSQVFMKNGQGEWIEL